MAQMQLSYMIDFIPGYSRDGKLIRKFLPAGSSSHGANSSPKDLWQEIVITEVW